MDFLWWIWALLALLFAVAEIFTAGFFLICFAIGAAAAGVLAYLGYGIAWQLIAFIGVSVAVLALLRPFAHRVSSQAENVFGIDRVIGKEAIVTVAIDPTRAHGRVRVEREEWIAESEDGQPIPDGTKVTVLSVNGTRLRVRPLPNERPPRNTPRRPEWA